MPITSSSELLHRWRADTGGCTLQIQEASDPAAALEALGAAARALMAIPHPDEEDEPLPSSVSPIRDHPLGPFISFDIADAEAYDGLLERVLEAIHAAVATADLDGILTSVGENLDVEEEDHGRPASVGSRPPISAQLGAASADRVAEGLDDARIVLLTQTVIDGSLRDTVLEVSPVSGEVRVIDTGLLTVHSVFVYQRRRMAVLNTSIISYDGELDGILQPAGTRPVSVTASGDFLCYWSLRYPQQLRDGRQVGALGRYDHRAKRLVQHERDTTGVIDVSLAASGILHVLRFQSGSTRPLLQRWDAAGLMDEAPLPTDPHWSCERIVAADRRVAIGGENDGSPVLGIVDVNDRRVHVVADGWLPLAWADAARLWVVRAGGPFVSVMGVLSAVDGRVEELPAYYGMPSRSAAVVSPDMPPAGDPFDLRTWRLELQAWLEGLPDARG